MKANKSAILCLSHYKGGMEIDSIKCAELFRDNEINHILICKQGTFIHELCKQKGINHIPVKFSRKFSLSLIYQLRRAFIDEQIKNIIFYGTSEIKSIYFAQLGLDITTCIRYGTTMSSSKKDTLHRLFYSCVKYHIGISEHICKNINDIIPTSKESKVIKCYPHSKWLEPLEKKERTGNKDIIHVSRVAPGKGHDDLVKIADKINNNINFIGSISDKNYKKYLDKCIEKTKRKERINFCGHTNNIWSPLKKHNIFVLPSHGEGLSNALIEALGSGLVCICYNNTVFPEFIKQGFYLHLVQDQNLEALADTINNITTNLDSELKKSKQNIVLCRQLFSEKNEISFYKELLKL